MGTTSESASSNGSSAGLLAPLRSRPSNVHLFRGFGPLVVGIILFLLMVTLAPTVAPEHVVVRPATPRATTTTVVVAP